MSTRPVSIDDTGHDTGHVPSLAMRTVVGLCSALPDAVMTRLFTKPIRRRRAELARRDLRNRHSVRETEVGLGRVSTIVPSAQRLAGRGAHVVLLHGGAYTMQDLPPHWDVVAMLLERDWTVSVVDYPLAPEHTVDQTLEMVLETWSMLAERHGPLHLLGDSAGGGLALVLLQHLRARSGPMPDRTVLLSPWVDLEMADAATIAADATDVVLPRAALLRCAEMYAGGRPLDDPVLSPLHGDLAGLGEVQAWVGTEELFWPQCRRLADLASAADGTRLELRVAAGLPHDWVLSPTPERRWLVDELTAFLRADERD